MFLVFYQSEMTDLDFKAELSRHPPLSAGNGFPPSDKTSVNISSQVFPTILIDVILFAFLHYQSYHIKIQISLLG